MRFPAVACVLLAAVALPAAAQDVHKCKLKNGHLVYQDHACAGDATDAGGVSGGYAAPISGSGTAAQHYEAYTRMMEQDRAHEQAERRRNEAEDRARRAEPRAEQADQVDYRKHQCQAELDHELDKHRYAAFSCDALGYKVPTTRPAVVVERRR